MSTPGSSLAGEGMYSKLIDDDGACDDLNRSPDVGLGAKDPSPEELLRQLQEERTCKVCMDKLVYIVFISCGHLVVVCGDCAASLRYCPICRAVIRGSVRAFMS